MPFNGSGTFSIINTFVPNTTILSAAVNQNFTDIATGLSDCLTRDGQAGMTAALKAINGSVGAPSITFTSDATSGLYLANTGILGMVSKSLGMLIDSAIYQASGATVQAGGTNYAVGDTITLTGGAAINQPVLTVATLTGSAVATVTVTYPGNIVTQASNPVAQGSTSGIGSGATFNLTYTTQYTASVVTDEAGNPVWSRLGASSFVSGLMAKANGLDFATAIGASNIVSVIGSSFLLPPSGVLSPISSTFPSNVTSDQTALTRIYWTPQAGNGIPIYNGTNFVNKVVGQLTCDLTAGAQALNGLYDVYAFLVAGVVTLGLSPSWSAGTSGSVTAGSCARGTGAGGTQLAYLSGLYVNNNAMTLNNGATTYSISANFATLLGSVYINAVAGQYNCHVSTGQARVWGLANAYNRRPIELILVDNTSSWNSAPTTWRQTRADANNYIVGFSSIPAETYEAQFSQTIKQSVNNTNDTADIGIGFNATNALSGRRGREEFSSAVAGTVLFSTQTPSALYVAPPSIGINKFNSLEQAPSGTTDNLFFGTYDFFAMTLKYRA